MTNPQNTAPTAESSNNKTVFSDIEVTPPNHFRLSLYGAILFLIRHVRQLVSSDQEQQNDAFEQYPFLKAYLSEILPYLPENISWQEAPSWWLTQVKNWEASSQYLLPLNRLRFSISGQIPDSIPFLLTGLIEEDMRFGSLYADLQAPLPFRRPCVDTLGRILSDHSDNDPWPLCRTLIDGGFVTVQNEDAPRSEWALRVPGTLWDVARGELVVKQHEGWTFNLPSEFPLMNELVGTESFLNKVQQIPRILLNADATALVLKGSPGSNRIRLAGSIARDLGCSAVQVNGKHLKEYAPLIGPLCSLMNAIPFIEFDMAPGETVNVMTLKGYYGPIFFVTGIEGGLYGKAVDQALTLQIPQLSSEERLRYWNHAFKDVEIDDIENINTRFILPGSHILQTAKVAKAYAALEKRERIILSDVKAASQTLNRQLLDNLADRLESTDNWSALVACESTESKLHELRQRCMYREKISRYLSQAYQGNTNRGVRTLFSGPSGTGKTFAAQLLAAYTELDIYRVDLASVINKYIGETEKNLHKVLTIAEELNVILLLDEGDALLGTRTDVRSANDRYANLETNYLLQRLEHYQGIVIITTNLGQNIDHAFQRRMDIIVDFYPPQPKERLKIWQYHLPAYHAIEESFLHELALRCELTGGQIRNAVYHATLQAVDDTDGLIHARHLEQGAKNEYWKAGGAYPLSDRTAENSTLTGSKELVDSMY